MTEKIKKLCTAVLNGSAGFDEFYDGLSNAAEDPQTSDDLAFVIEDELMELEMLGERVSSGKKIREAAKDSAKRIIAAIESGL